MTLLYRCNAHSEDLSVTTSKIIVDFELQFSCAKHDFHRLFD